MQGLAFPRASEVGVVRLVLPGVRVEAWVVWGGGGVVRGVEEVGAVHHLVASWCVVAGGGEGVVQIVHEGHVRVKKVPTRTGPCCTPSTISCHSNGLASHQVLHDLPLSCTISHKK